jgi:hypothetical protein
MIPVLTSFLPPSHPHLYLPVIFKLWEAFNSFSMDDRFLELAGNLAEEHVAGNAGSFGEEGGAQWKDVGIWSEQEWTLLVSKGFESMCRLLSMYLSSPRLTLISRRSHRKIQSEHTWHEHFCGIQSSFRIPT